MSFKVLTTAEVSAQTGLTPRSVRRRLGTEFPARVTIEQGNRVTLGTTTESVRAFKRSQKTSTN